jgi:hypothetical protein
LEGREKGHQATVQLEPADAFGPRDEQLVQTIPKTQFPPPSQFPPPKKTLPSPNLHIRASPRGPDRGLAKGDGGGVGRRGGGGGVEGAAWMAPCRHVANRPFLRGAQSPKEGGPHMPRRP